MSTMPANERNDVPIRSLGYIRWQTPQFDEWVGYATDILGMMPTAGPRPEARYFRIDKYPYRFVLIPGERQQVDALGFEVADDLELAAVVERVTKAGRDVTPGTPEEADERLVGGFVSFDEPSGVRIEVFYGPILNHLPVQTPLVSGFVTGEQGLGHAVLAVDRPEETVDFFREVLGFQLRNTGRLNVAGRPTLTTISFLGCNPRHHTLGVVGMDIPGNMLHFMLEAKTIDDVGYALDRCLDAEIPLAMTLGRHTNDHMISFYSISPDRLQVEFGWGGLEIDSEASTTYEITKVSFWGHRRNPPPAK